MLKCLLSGGAGEATLAKGATLQIVRLSLFSLMLVPLANDDLVSNEGKMGGPNKWGLRRETDREWTKEHCVHWLLRGGR